MSTQYSEDREDIFSPEYIPSNEEEPGFEFAVLNRQDRQNVLGEAIAWRHYENKGISHAQQRIILANVLDGKPQENWLDGVFDDAVLENDRIRALKISVENRRNSPDNHLFDEMDGSRLSWGELSAAAKLQYIAGDATRTEVSFKAFAEVARDVIGEDMEAALRIVLEGQKELHAIAKLFPDDGRTEPTPVVEQVKDSLAYIADQETQERREGREKLFKRISSVLDGKPLESSSPHFLTLRDLLRDDKPPEEEYEEILTGDKFKALMKEVREDEAAGKREDAHWYGKDTIQKLLDGTTKTPAAEKSKDEEIER